MAKRMKAVWKGDHGSDSAAQARRREGLLRPWPTLGYDRDRIALHMMHIEALPVAESELRRAVWLNPFEWHFKYHLAVCLFREKKYAEARDLMQQVMKDHSDEFCCRKLMRSIECALVGRRRGDGNDNI